MVNKKPFSENELLSPLKPPFKGKSTGKCGFKDISGGKGSWEEFREERQKIRAYIEKFYVFDDPEYSERFNKLVDYINSIDILLSGQTNIKIVKINHCFSDSNFIVRNNQLWEHIINWPPTFYYLKKPNLKIRKYIFTENKIYKNQFNKLIKIIKHLEKLTPKDIEKIIEKSNKTT